MSLAAVLAAASSLASCGACSAAADEIVGAECVLTWGEGGEGPGQFKSPIGIAIDGRLGPERERIFVTDLNNARVQSFSTDGKLLGGFDLPRDAPERKTNLAGGIAIDDDGLIYLSYMGQHKIAVYTDDGRLVREWGQKGSADGELLQPGGIVLGPDDTLYVGDQGNHRVQQFTTDGKFVAKWGEYGEQPGQFDGLQPRGSRFAGPHFVSRDSQGRLYTTEGTRGRIQQFTSAGEPLLAWGDKSDEPGGFGAYAMSNAPHTFGPIAVFVDPHDRVWVSSLNDRVQHFTTEGKFVLAVGGTGTAPGQFVHPHGMAMDSAGHLYVADAGNQRIQKFKLRQ
jgi:sugar lactone lactonase YvrE